MTAGPGMRTRTKDKAAKAAIDDMDSSSRCAADSVQFNTYRARWSPRQARGSSARGGAGRLSGKRMAQVR
ncbi:hypothetical protein GCM10027360_43740 [Amycolatopsis echigonensis]